MKKQSSPATSLNADYRETELESTHIPWANLLREEGIPARTWGSAGPDFLLTENGAIIETKREDSKNAVRSAYREILRRRGHRQFDPSLAPFICVITPGQIYVWRNRGGGEFAPPQEPDVVFGAEDKQQFIKFVRSHDPQAHLFLDRHIGDVLRLVYSRRCPNPLAALIYLLNLHKEPVIFTRESVIFAPGTQDERTINTDAETQQFLKREIDRYRVLDPASVRSHIRHQWSRYQPDDKKAALGKYYTPQHLVRLVRRMIEPHLAQNPDARVADLAAGCGAFLAEFEDCHIIGRDIDPDAVLILREMGYPRAHLAENNSLKNVARSRLGIDDATELFIVGNPPYNDTTSLNRRYSTDKKASLKIERDPDLASKDMGIAFLRAYAKLKPRAICVLHPLSYLIKRKNFEELSRPFADETNSFTNQYRLESAAVFSSAEFGSAVEGATRFPIVAALYVRGKMDYNEIKRFPFPIFEGEGRFADSGRRLVVENVCTIDGHIRKYPPSAGMLKVSNIGIYQYNIRDTNSLLTSGALSTNTDENRIPVQFDQLWQYGYLNCYKRYFGRHFIFGNLSPLFDPVDADDEEFRDRCIIDTIVHNQHLWPFDRKNGSSFIIERFLLNDFRRKAKGAAKNGSNLYAAFITFWLEGVWRFDLAGYFQGYFAKLREQSLAAAAATGAAKRTQPPTLVA
jgi:hypothetical protein